MGFRLLASSADFGCLRYFHVCAPFAGLQVQFSTQAAWRTRQTGSRTGKTENWFCRQLIRPNLSQSSSVMVWLDRDWLIFWRQPGVCRLLQARSRYYYCDHRQCTIWVRCVYIKFFSSSPLRQWSNIWRVVEEEHQTSACPKLPVNLCFLSHSVIHFTTCNIFGPVYPSPPPLSAAECFFQHTNIDEKCWTKCFKRLQTLPVHVCMFL